MFYIHRYNEIPQEGDCCCCSNHHHVKIYLRLISNFRSFEVSNEDEGTFFPPFLDSIFYRFFHSQQQLIHGLIVGGIIVGIIGSIVHKDKCLLSVQTAAALTVEV